MARYAYEPFPYHTPPELSGETVSDAPVLIVGAGPIGLATAVDLATKGIASIVLDDNDVVSVGSRAICWAKRTLEIFDRLGVADRMLAKGVTWKLGRVYRGDDEIYTFDLLPEDGHKFPAFINDPSTPLISYFVFVLKCSVANWPNYYATFHLTTLKALLQLLLENFIICR